jgi:adenine-specific DNA-methyltransferase
LTPDLFADFNGMPKNVDKTEFYQHDRNWSNRMILGDSLQVMTSLAEREGLRGKVQPRLRNHIKEAQARKPRPTLH